MSAPTTDSVLHYSCHTIAAFDHAAVLERGAVLPVDKPQGWTSFDVVAKVRNLLRVRKVGHAGTLDPMATGLLVLCLGRATKLADALQAGVKEYTGVIRLGLTTDSLDAEGEGTGIFPTEHITEEMIRRAAAQLTGDLLQVPPMFSAIKVDGQRLYKLARRGQQLELPPRAVTVHQFQVLSVAMPDVAFRIECSKGTYVRSLARDLGLAVHSGAHLAALRRTASGPMRVEDAVTIDQLREIGLPAAGTFGPAGV